MGRGGLFLTAGADVQKDRIEVDVWAWGRGLESWLVDHIVIDGGPENARSWDALQRLLSQTWPHAHGAQLGLAKLAIDTGYESPAVYAWARRAGYARAAAWIAGADRWTEAMWRDLEQQVGRSPDASPDQAIEPDAVGDTMAGVLRRRPERRARRVFRSSYLS